MLLCRKPFQTPENYKSDQIGRQNEQNVELRRKPFKTAKLQKWSKYNDFHRFDVKNFKTTLNYKSDQLTWISSIWCSNDQNNAKQRKWSNYDEFASIWCQKLQNNAKLQK